MIVSSHTTWKLSTFFNEDKDRQAESNLWIEKAGKWGKLKFQPCNVILIYGRKFVSLVGLYGTLFVSVPVNTVLWVITLCSLVEIYRLQENLATSIFVILFRPEDGGGTFLCNVSAFFWECTQKTVFIVVPRTGTSIFAYCEIRNFQELDVGLANGIRAMNITHTGELGYVLYIPNEVREVAVWHAMMWDTEPVCKLQIIRGIRKYELRVIIMVCSFIFISYFENCMI